MSSKDTPPGNDFFSISVSHSAARESIYLNLDICATCMPKLGALVNDAIERSRKEQQERTVDYQNYDRERVNGIVDEVTRRLSTAAPSVGAGG